MCSSKWAIDDWQRNKDRWTIKLLQEEAFQLTTADREAVRLARELIERVYKYKFAQLACTAIFVNGAICEGVHNYVRRTHEFSQCAESEPINISHRLHAKGEPYEIATIVTYHGNHDRYGNRTGDPYIVAPCERCIRLLEEENPNVLIVQDLDGAGRLAKVPLEACHYFRHPRRHNGES